MKGLTTLIKLHKRQLDGLRRRMATLENQKTQLENLIKRLQDELARELVLAGKTPEMGNFFGDFAKRIRNRQEQVTKEIAELEKKIVALKEEIAIAFGEMKKFEIALENAKRRQREEANRKETIQLDEIAGQQFNRKAKETQ